MIEYSLDDHVRALAACLPNGDTFEGKNIQGSNLNQLLRGLATEFKRGEDYLITLENEYFPDNTSLFLDEWEKAIGIPDTCFPGNGTTEERRLHIVLKLSSLGVQTASDLEELALLFGLTLTVTGQDQFTIRVEGSGISSSWPPYDVPFDVGGGANVLTCLFEHLIPANTDLLFVEA